MNEALFTFVIGLSLMMVAVYTRQNILEPLSLPLLLLKHGAEKLKVSTGKILKTIQDI
ncbi:MAG: hypothetical protein AAF549_02420 [Pseudomonadota bacterium]